ncbi:hypothetical protein DFJ74DRAFT_362887 [Hyaloraphidium curvatum]|nr:hypothetical protein DFJ74DRAFT_362887 [Hyaloraphidium curvatum]
MPSIQHETEDVVLVTVKRYFYGGFALLPWLWLFNFLYVLPIIKRPNLKPAIKHYAFASLSLSLIFFVALTTWFTWFLLNGSSLGPTGDKLSVVIPKGSV